MSDAHYTPSYKHPGSLCCFICPMHVDFRIYPILFGFTSR